MNNMALFDPEGKPLESFYVFIYWYYSNLLKYGKEVTPIEDGVEDISVNPIDFEQFSFPETKLSLIQRNKELQEMLYGMMVMMQIKLKILMVIL